MGIAIDAWLRVYEAVLSDWGQASAAIDDRSRMRAAADYLRTLYEPLKSRDEVQAQRRRFEQENRALRRQLDGMRRSTVWKLAERYERLRTRLTGR